MIETNKKCILWCFLFVILIMSGCQSLKSSRNKPEKVKTSEINMPDSDSYIPGEDGCNTFSDGVQNLIVSGKGGYYFRNGDRLCFYDTKTDKTVYVCSKPECQHEPYDVNCDAHIDGVDHRMYFYKNDLYVVSDDSASALENPENGTRGIYLIRYSADASEKENLYCFIHWVEGEGVSYNTYIHRGYLYYCVSNNSVDEKKKVILYRRALGKNAPEEVVYETEGYGTGINSMMAYGNSLYILEDGFKKENGEEPYSLMLKCNIHTKKTDLILQDFYGYCVKIKDKLYVMDKDRKKLLQLSKEGKEEKELYSIDDVCNTVLRTDGTYLYLYKEEKDKKEDVRKGNIQIIDTNGKKISTLNNTDEFAGGDDSYLFFRKSGMEKLETSQEEEYVEHMYYYKKSDLTSGDYSLRKEMSDIH